MYIEKDKKILEEKKNEIKKLISQNRLDEAEELCKKFSRYAPIQRQLVNIYINQEKYHNAIAICSRFITDEIMQQKLVDVYKILENNKKDSKKSNSEIKTLNEVKPVCVSEKKKKEKTKKTMVSGTMGVKKNLNKNRSCDKKNNSKNLIKDNLSKEIKKAIFDIKLDCYRKFININTKKDALLKYDVIEECLCSLNTNDKALKRLLLILIGSGYDELIEKEYNNYYDILKKQIEDKTLSLSKR